MNAYWKYISMRIYGWHGKKLVGDNQKKAMVCWTCHEERFGQAGARRGNPW